MIYVYGIIKPSVLIGRWANQTIKDILPHTQQATPSIYSVIHIAKEVSMNIKDTYI